MYKALRYLKVSGSYVERGREVALEELSRSEVQRLVDAKKIVPVDRVGVSTPEDEKIDAPSADNDEMTDEEVKAELLEKISHTLAVRELKLLGAEFKGNASLESLVELIMENEDYEDHFLDYIEQNEL